MSLKEAIKKTIDYAKNFNSEINQQEIIERLISNKVYSKEEIKKNIDINLLVKLPNPWKENKISKAKGLVYFLKKHFKEILFLGISGSVASGHPKKNDDIDLVIITKQNRLWLTRFKLRIFIFLNKIPHRKYGQKEIRDEFCFNLWLDEKELKLPKEKQTLQSATDLIMVIPLINKQNIYEKFLLENDWSKKYLATGYYQKTKDIKTKKEKFNMKQNWLDGLLNKAFFWPQYWYMRKKITLEIINLHQAFFHKRNDRMK